jgi:hypothetical protein
MKKTRKVARRPTVVGVHPKKVVGHAANRSDLRSQKS